LTVATSTVYLEITAAFKVQGAREPAMLIVFGQKRYGKVDHVPGLFYVVTEFFHFYYVPLIPLKSYVMFDVSAGAPPLQGTPISMNFKSVFMGWIRAILVCGFVFGLLVGGTEVVHYWENNQKTPVDAFLIPSAVAALSSFLYWLTTRLTRASFERALALADQIGLASEHVEKSFMPQADTFEEYEQTDRYQS
jgi:hypothetical protein